MLTLILIWIISGFISYGITFAYYQGKYQRLAEKDYREDMGTAFVIGLFGGIFGLLVMIGWTGFAQYGFKIK